MSYLRLIKKKIQELSETVASVLDIEVAIADKNLTRIVGTGQFYSRLEEDCSDDSLFAKVIETGQPIINLNPSENCENCSSKDECTEFANMSYPLKSEGEIIGVVSFATFDMEQADILQIRSNEYFNMLMETAWIVEREIRNAKMTNKLNKEFTEINEIINCIDKGIIILNKNKEIVQINSKALDSLGLSVSDDIVLKRNIEDFIEGIKYEERPEVEVGIWKINNKKIRVMYTINKISISNNKFNIMISFDFIEDIINIARAQKDKSKIKFENIIGQSDSLLKSIRKSSVASKTDSSILLLGESGTGKELFARSIHNSSNRKNGPFIVINCGSIPENLIESELFGYEKGAFTGADLRGKKGKIELANKGTLFLDEIGDLPLFLQTRLLRVLQEQTVDRLGGENPIDVDVRIISATNRDLIDLVNKGEFRLDLYYRLNVIPIELPPLRERGDDVLLCSNFILENLSNKMNINKKELSDEVIEKFQTYNWPGNIRELENILEHGICFAKGKYIELKDLPEYFIKNRVILEKRNNRKGYIEEFSGKDLDDMKIMFEKKVIEEKIEEFGNTTEGKKKAAEELGIALTTLYRKLN